MASFVGIIYDENENPVQGYHQAFHYNTGKWSDIRLSGADGYYSRDHEDTDWDGNGVPLPTSDIIILVFWQTGTDKTGLKDRMSIFKIISDGSNVYNYNVQIIPKTVPTCNWSVSTEGTINKVVSSTQSSSDVYQWVWDNKTFLHDDNYYGQTIFNSVSNLLHLYDWGEGYVNDNSKTYSIIGDYDLSHKATNSYNLFSECPKNIRIRYNEPTLSFNISSPNILFDVATIDTTIVDVDSQISNIEYYIDGVLIDSNTILDYSFTRNIDTYKDYVVLVKVYWWDGFNNVVKNFSSNIIVDNTAPVTDISINNVNSTYTFVSNAFDLESGLEIVQFKIYLCSTAIFEETPTNCNWSLLDTSDVLISDWNKSATFYKGGKFKVQAQAKDNEGLWGNISSLEFDVVQETNIEDSQGQHFFDWE